MGQAFQLQIRWLQEVIWEREDNELYIQLREHRDRVAVLSCGHRTLGNQFRDSESLSEILKLIIIRTFQLLFAKSARAYTLKAYKPTYR